MILVRFSLFDECHGSIDPCIPWAGPGPIATHKPQEVQHGPGKGRRWRPLSRGPRACPLGPAAAVPVQRPNPTQPRAGTAWSFSQRLSAFARVQSQCIRYQVFDGKTQEEYVHMLAIHQCSCRWSELNRSLFGSSCHRARNPRCGNLRTCPIHMTFSVAKVSTNIGRDHLSSESKFNQPYIRAQATKSGCLEAQTIPTNAFIPLTNKPSVSRSDS